MYCNTPTVSTEWSFKWQLRIIILNIKIEALPYIPPPPNAVFRQLYEQFKRNLGKPVSTVKFEKTEILKVKTCPDRILMPVSIFPNLSIS